MKGVLSLMKIQAIPFIISQITAWIFFLLADSRVQFPFIFVVLAISTLAFAIYSAAFIARRGNSRRLIGVEIAHTFLILVIYYATIYQSYGTTANFSSDLTHVDAIYFSLGTLTTAGTGNISPTSGLARGLVSTQMVLDLIFIGGAVAIAVSRWSETINRKREK